MLKREFGLSRTPVREALIRLVSEGLFTLLPTAIPRVTFACATIEACLGLRLPSANQSAGDTPKALCCGSHRWLFIGERAVKARLLTDLERAAHDTAAVGDLSDSRSMFRFSGLGAVEILAKGCAIDLEPPAMRVGCVAVTAMANLPVLVYMVSSELCFGVYVPRSYAEYARDWTLLHAARFSQESSTESFAT